MLLRIAHQAGSFTLDTTYYHDISIAVSKTDNVNCYHLDEPQFAYFKSPEFSGDLKAGGSVNCEKFTLYAHASGTHTECALHVADADFDMRDLEWPVMMMAQLLTVDPSVIGNDRVIDRNALGNWKHETGFDAIIIRTLPNEEYKLHRNYSGSNPAYFDPELIAYFKDLGYRHLICDLPSIDKESDEGKLAAHKVWFLENGIASRKHTVSELVYIDSSIEDGKYGLSMQAPKIQTDAVPSRILIYPCQ